MSSNAPIHASLPYPLPVSSTDFDMTKTREPATVPTDDEVKRRAQEMSSPIHSIPVSYTRRPDATVVPSHGTGYARTTDAQPSIMSGSPSGSNLPYPFPVVSEEITPIRLQ
ncbi:hypothetical protein BCR39DRAFT_548995 [Naematelia encephala]|uniref:Uncharacterized protein n=1 Tax=Naematelia encephala TaxID=71784 RepID=A0A1Y2AMA7_9TREE|nr:hypothetical protein BCR39DRAFT_548995 [Naematelia encephala]